MAKRTRLSSKAAVTAAPGADMGASATERRINSAAAFTSPAFRGFCDAVAGNVASSAACHAAAEARKAPPVAANRAPTPGSAASRVPALITALGAGPQSVAALASSLGCTPGAVRNTIDNARRTRGTAFIVAHGGGVFGLVG